MKKINKLLIAIFGFATFTACETTEFDALLANPNQLRPEDISLNDGVNQVQLSLASFHSGIEGVGARLMRQTHSFGTTWQNAFAPDTGGGAWSTAYSGILNDCASLIPLAQLRNAPYQEGMLRVARAYTLMTLVDYWGDVPYSEALLGQENFSPALDTGANVYAAALADLNAAKSIFVDLKVTFDDDADDSITYSTDLPGTSLPTDMFYNASNTEDAITVQPWINLINTLKFKYYLNLGDATNLQALVDATGSVDGGFIGATEDFAFQYGTSTLPDSRHPYYRGSYDAPSPAAYTANYLMWTMTGIGGLNPAGSGDNGEKDIADPRLRYYFYRQELNYPTATSNPTIDEALSCNDDSFPYTSFGVTETPFCFISTGYWGRDLMNADGIGPDNNDRTAVGSYPAGGYTDNGQDTDIDIADRVGSPEYGIQPIFMHSFIQFMRAEAGLRGLTSDDPATFIGQAVTDSCNDVQERTNEPLPLGTATDITTYVGQINTDFTGAADDDARLEILGKEFLIATFGNGTEAYNMYRRIGKPVNLQAPLLEASAGAFPRSLFYPINTANLNASIAQKADLTTQVFWDSGLTLD